MSAIMKQFLLNNAAHYEFIGFINYESYTKPLDVVVSHFYPPDSLFDSLSLSVCLSFRDIFNSIANLLNAY